MKNKTAQRGITCTPKTKKKQKLQTKNSSLTKTGIHTQEMHAIYIYIKMIAKRLLKLDASR